MEFARGLHDLAGPLWLDVTRLVSRVGRGPLTGIDRVEHAYLDHLVDRPGTRFLLRSTRGYMLLGGDGARALLDMVGGAAPGRADIWSRAIGRGGRMRHRVEARLRPLAVDRCAPWRLPRLLARQASGSFTYLNTGHANLSHATLSAMAGAGARSVVMVHDLIPITHHELVSPTQRAAFPAKIDTILRFSADIICNSGETETALTRHWADAPEVPRLFSAHLGVPPPRTDTPTGPRQDLLMVGTLDPRKNHAVILKAMSILAEDNRLPPDTILHIIGSKGWNGAEITAAIKAHPLFGTQILLHPDGDDAVLERLYQGASCLLFPSLAEGFGFPPWEALGHGVLPICADLPVLQGLLGNRAVYLDPHDAYSWADTIEKRISGNLPLSGAENPEFPTWQDHFSRVAAHLGGGTPGQKGPS